MSSRLVMLLNGTMMMPGVCIDIDRYTLFCICIV